MVIQQQHTLSITLSRAIRSNAQAFCDHLGDHELVHRFLLTMRAIVDEPDRVRADRATGLLIIQMGQFIADIPVFTQHMIGLLTGQHAQYPTPQEYLNLWQHVIISDSSPAPPQPG